MISISLLFFQADFLTNHNAQSLVEICITRLTSAVRETGTIETLAAPLVSFDFLLLYIFEFVLVAYGQGFQITVFMQQVC